MITSLSLPDDPDTITLIASLVHSRSPQQGGGGSAEEGGGASAGATSGEPDAPLSGQESGKGEGQRVERERVKICVPKLPESFTGTGDLIAALLLAWFQRGAVRVPLRARGCVCVLTVCLCLCLCVFV